MKNNVSTRVDEVGAGSSASSERYHDDEEVAISAGLDMQTKPTVSAHDEETPLLDHGEGDVIEEWPGQRDFEGVTWYRKPSLLWLLPPFFLFTVAFGGILVPKLNLILSLICRQYLTDHSVNPQASTFMLSDKPECRVPEVQALSTRFALYMSVIAGTLSAMTSPKLGELSDRYGRTRILVITSFGGVVGEVITIACASWPDQLSYWWMLVGSFFEGAAGSFIVGMAITHSYASDITPPSKRSVAFGYFHACLFGGVALGPLVSGFIVKWTGNILSIFYVALVCHIIFMLFLLFVVPESLSKKRQMAARNKYEIEQQTVLRPVDGNSTKMQLVYRFLHRINIFEPLKILWPTGPGTSRQLRMNLILLAAVDTTIFGVAMGSMAVVTYYSIYMFGWGNFETSLFMSLASTTRVTALIVILPLATYVVRKNREKAARRTGIVHVIQNTGSDKFDLNLIRFSIFCEIVGYVGYSTVRIPHLFVVSGVIASFGGIGSPTLQSALTKHVPHGRTGQLLGATGLLHALARIVCPMLSNLVYSQTVGTFPQTVFIVLATLFALAFGFSWFVRPYVYLQDEPIAGRCFEEEDEGARRPGVTAGGRTDEEIVAA